MLAPGTNMSTPASMGHVQSSARGADIRAICPLAAAKGGHVHFPKLPGPCFRGHPEWDMSILRRGEWT